ncbi:MAG: serine hydrolase [Clostridia bacterium]|nr:serine hydrolase [Clostridia bacterium]
MKTMDFEAFADQIRAQGWRVHGAEAYERQHLCGSFGDTASLFPIYSATKTVLSVAVGIAADEGRFDLGRSVLDYLDGKTLAGLSGQQREAFAPLTLHRLMTMSVEGFPFRPEGEDYLRFSLTCPLPDPGTPSFHYSNIPAYLTGVALTNALGEDAAEWIGRRLMEPLGIAEWSYDRCPSGYFYGASGMKLSVNSLSRIGLLLMQGGDWHGERIVSEAYVKKATSALQMNREGGYGYFIWKYRDGFSINGKWKQKCYILPAQGLVITYLSDIRDDSHDLLRSMEKHLLGIPE